MMLPRLVRAATLVALAMPAVSAAAQAPRPGQRASVPQRIGPAGIVLTYNRPIVVPVHIEVASVAVPGEEGP